MKKVIYICTMIVFTMSCTTENQDDFVKIKGKVLSDNVKQVKIEWLKENPINQKGATYEAIVDSNSNFTFEIPVENLATGRISSNGFYHEICLISGDDFSIIINGDSIDYKGKGAAKNNFLYVTEKKGIWTESIYRRAYEEDFTLNEYLLFVNEIGQNRLELLSLSNNKNQLDERFVEYYKVETQVVLNSTIQDFPRMYSYKSKIHEDSLQLPLEYHQANQLSLLIDDKKIISSSYLDNLRNAIYKQALGITKADTSLELNVVRFNILLDSLTGKTKEYALANWICGKLSFRDEYDSLAFNIFNKINKDEISNGEVQKALDIFDKKQVLIGQPLNSEFEQTLLLDTSNTELLFSEMMSKYKGKVVYLDMWSLGCGPCRMAMPYSKMLKEKLSDIAVEFVYVTNDKYTDKLWNNIFEVSLTTENHYIFKNGFNSKLHEFMGIMWVPNYMIFDKKGHLVNYNAERPTVEVEYGVSKLEKELRMLAGE